MGGSFPVWMAQRDDEVTAVPPVEELLEASWLIAFHLPANLFISCELVSFRFVVFVRENFPTGYCAFQHIYFITLFRTCTAGVAVFKFRTTAAVVPTHHSCVVCWLGGSPAFKSIVGYP